MTLRLAVVFHVALGVLIKYTTTSPVSMTLQVKGADADSFIQINFYEDHFEKLYTCMLNTDSLTCTARLARDEKHENEAIARRAVDVQKPQLLKLPRDYSNVFTCSCDLKDQQLACTRLLSNSSICGSQIKTEFLHFLNDSSVSGNCVGFRWKSVNESLSYDSSVHGIEICNTSCNDFTRNISINKNENQSITLPSLKPEYTTFNHTEDPPKHHHRDHEDFDKDDNDEDSDKTHIIIAAVVSMGVTASLIIAGILFRRQLMKMRKRPDAYGDYDIGNSRSTSDTNGNNDHIGKLPSKVHQKSDSRKSHLTDV